MLMIHSEAGGPVPPSAEVNRRLAARDAPAKLFRSSGGSLILLSPSALVRAEPLGHEGESVLVIDDAAADPQALLADACARPFTRIGPYYPGVRAAVQPAFVQDLSAALSPIIANGFGIRTKQWAGECFYSLVTTPPAQLQPIQRLPHYDGLEEDRIAVLHYLFTGDQGGTAFYRHRATGYETVNVARFPAYRQSLEADVRKHGLPPARYIDDGTPLFDRILAVQPAFNRMLVYRGFVLHCSAISPDAALAANPAAGRLTLNAFLTPVRA